MSDEKGRLKDGMPQGRIAADFKSVGIKGRIYMASVKTRNGNVAEDLKVPRY